MSASTSAFISGLGPDVDGPPWFSWWLSLALSDRCLWDWPRALVFVSL